MYLNESRDLKVSDEFFFLLRYGVLSFPYDSLNDENRLGFLNKPVYLVDIFSDNNASNLFNDCVLAQGEKKQYMVYTF